MTNKLNTKLNPSFENTPDQPSGRKGRGDKREVTKRIDEFFPRGAAGRREAHGPKSFSKTAMPRSGRRTTRQKTK
jgi:hypothetical protein